jgi:putative endonuclease
LIYYEVGEDFDSVLAREKQIKGWTRKKKEDLIKEMNPSWEDLYNQIL